MKQRIDKNIYHNPKCTKRPYSVNLTIRGHRFSRACSTVEEAQTARDEFIESMADKETEDPNVVIRDEKYIVEIFISKRYETLYKATEAAEKLRKFND